jgi:hypothetical protein
MRVLIFAGMFGNACAAGSLEGEKRSKAYLYWLSALTVKSATGGLAKERGEIQRAIMLPARVSVTGMCSGILSSAKRWLLNWQMD